MLTRPRTTNPAAIAIPTTPESTCITRHGPGCGFLSSRIALLCHCSEPEGSLRTDNCRNSANTDYRGGLRFRKNTSRSILTDYAKPDVAGANGEQFPGDARVLAYKAYDFSVGCFEEPVEPHVMLLDAGVTEIVARSARKTRQMRRPVKFEGSAAPP